MTAETSNARELVAKLAAHVRPTCSELWAEAQAFLAAEGVQAGEVSAYDLAVLDDAAETLDRIGEGSAGLREARARIASALSQQPEARDGGEVAAWETEDGRVISARQKATALRDGGASASSVAPYTTPLYRTAPPSAPVGVEAIAAEIRASLGRGATDSTRRRWAIELETLAQQPAAVDASDARDAERYRWLRRALLGAEDEPIDHLLLEKEPETEAEFDAAVDAALAAQQGGAK